MTRPRILLVSPNLPYPANSGGAQRTALFLESLQKLGEVDCVFLPSGETPPESVETISSRVTGSIHTESANQIQRAHLMSLPGGAIAERISSDLSAFLQAGRYRWRPNSALIDTIGSLEQYDLVIARYLSAACMLDLFRHSKLIVDIDDYDPERLQLRLKNASYFKKLTLRRVYRYSKQAHEERIPRIPNCLISNPNDRQHPGLQHATLLPNIPYQQRTHKPDNPTVAQTSQTLLMVGTFDYSANRDGAEAFIQSAWPKIRAACPKAQLQLVGRGLSAKLNERWSQIPGIHIAGYVPSLQKVYQECLATIAPIQAGGGTNIKVLESAQYGRTIIMTATAQRGFETTLPDNKTCLVAQSIEQMAEPCIRLLKDPTMALAMGQAAQRQIAKHYTREQFEGTLHQVCTRVLETSQPE